MAQSSPNPRPRSAAPFLAWVWAGLLIFGGAGYLGISTGLINYTGPLVPVLAVAVAALSLPFIARWLTHRDEWWAALTAWVFVAMAALLFLILLRLPYDQITGAAALLAIAVPFAAVYAGNHARWWALIPAYALVVLAGLLALTIVNIPLESLGAFALLAAALPFWIAYMLNRMLWWALVPAGVLSAAGVILLGVFAATRPGSAGFYVILNAALAVVALALWLTVRRFDWAMWLAVGFALAAVLAIWFPSGASLALVALALGMYIAYKQIDAVQSRASQAHASQPGTAVPQPPLPAATPPPAAAAPAVQAAPPPQPSSPPSQASLDAAARREADTAARPGPVVEFRPLDPFKARKEKPEDDDPS